jgi:hypothetical protein
MAAAGELLISGILDGYLFTNSAAACLKSADVGSVFDVSEVHIASVFRVDCEDDGSMYLRNVGNTTHISELN